MTGLLKKDGKTLVPHIKERIHEIVTTEMLVLEAEATFGITIDRRQMQMLTPNEMADPAQESTDEPEEQKENNENQD